ncbi:hypothetical protein ACFL7D_02820 [candidate division KSB1 bacterium]
MKRPQLYIIAFLCSALILNSCIWARSSGENKQSIFDRDFALTIQSEMFPEYEWNNLSRNANVIYLKSLNNYFFKYNYDAAASSFFEANDIYPYDARIYVRIAECRARTGDINLAIDMLNMGNEMITGFLDNPGVRAYMTELQAAGVSGNVPAEVQEPKGIVGKSLDVLTWVPRKTYSFIKGLF